MENTREGTHSNKNSRSISSEESAGLSASTFGLPRHSHGRCSGKNETPIGYYAAIILNYKNVAKHLWREPQIIKFENALHIWINIGYIFERTLSAVSHVNSRFHARLTHCNLQSQLNCAFTPFVQNFTKLVSYPKSSGVLLMGSRIIYFNKCNRLDIKIFRL